MDKQSQLVFVDLTSSSTAIEINKAKISPLTAILASFACSSGKSKLVSRIQSLSCNKDTNLLSQRDAVDQYENQYQ